MKNIRNIALLVLMSVVLGCSESDDVPTVELQSFSSLVRDVFEKSENDEAVSVIEGVDFKFEDAGQLETYSDLLSD